MTEEVQAKYILGCDDDRSAVGPRLLIESSIQQTNDSWVLADVYTKTNFPDARRRCAIRTEQRSLMLIPIADNGVRVYILLTGKYNSIGEKCTNDQTVIDILTKRIISLLKPYESTITKLEWVSKYLIAPAH